MKNQADAIQFHHKHFFQRILALILLISLCTGPAATIQAAPAATQALPVIEPALITALDRVLDKSTNRGIPGVTVAISIPGYQTWYGARGLADRKQSQPIDAANVFRIGSLSKMFYATVIMQLVQEGKLELDKPVSTWMPNVVPNADKITVRHLMSHTSGLYDYLENRFMRMVLQNPQRVWKPQELVGYAVERGAYFAPGTAGRWRYSNTNYVVLGMLIENVTGHTLAQETRQRILDPLKLTHTFIEPDERVQGTLVHGYAGSSDWTNLHSSYAWGSANVVSSVDDLRRFAEALFGGQLLKPETFALMNSFVSGQGSFGMPKLEYGLGIMRNQLLVGPGPNRQPRPASLTTALGHIGGVGGYRAAVWYFPEQKITIVAGFNEANVNPVVLPTDILDAVLTYQGK